MASGSLSILENAVLAALGARIGSHVKTLETYQGDWLADLKLRSWRLPAILLMLKESRAQQVSPHSYDLTLDLTVLVVVRQLRGEAPGRREEKGAYELLAEIRQALWHQDLELDILPLALVREEPRLNTQEFTVYAALYRTGEFQDF
jgi:phage gp37-like protein